MSEGQTKNEQNQNQGSQDQEQQDQEPKPVTLTVEQYNALLDKLDDYEDQLQGKKGKTGDVVQDLADEGKGGRKTPQQQVDLDSLSQSQLADYIMRGVQGALQPIAVQIESILLQQEIRDLDESEAKVFKEYKDEIFDTLDENPKLSVKKAVKLAMKDKPKEGDTSDKGKDRLLRHLPEAKGPHSERPGRVSDNIDKNPPKDRVSAVERALEDLDIKFQT